MSIPIQNIPTKFAINTSGHPREIFEVHAEITDTPELILFDTEQEAREHFEETFGTTIRDTNYFRIADGPTSVEAPTLLTKDNHVYVMPNYGLYKRQRPETSSMPESDIISAVHCSSAGSNGHLHINYTTEAGRTFTVNRAADFDAPDGYQDGVTGDEGYRVFFSMNALKGFLNEQTQKLEEQLTLSQNFYKRATDLEAEHSGKHLGREYQQGL